MAAHVITNTIATLISARASLRRVVVTILHLDRPQVLRHHLLLLLLLGSPRL